MLKDMKENSKDITMQDIIFKQRIVISFTLPQSVKSTWRLEHVGENTVARDILEYVAMGTDALEENCVATCTLMIRAIAVMYSRQKSTSASSAQKAFVIIVHMGKHISRISMKWNQMKIFRTQKNQTVTRFTRINTLAEVISCTDTLTLLAVRHGGGSCCPTRGALPSRTSC